MAAITTAASVAVVSSRTISSARSRAALVGARPATFDDDTWCDGGEAAVICTVPSSHAALARVAVERGMHVLIEKPLTATLAEARDLASLAAEYPDVRFLYGENWLYQEVVQQAVALARQRGVTAVSVWTLHPPPEWGSYLDPTHGGGVLYELGCHSIGLARALLGRPRTQWVEAELVQGETGVDVEARVHVGFEGEREARISVTWTSDSRRTWAEAGGLQLELQPTPALFIDNVEIVNAASRSSLDWVSAAGYVGEVDALLGRRAPLATLDDGVAVMEILCAAYASAGEGRRLAVPLLDASWFRTPAELWRS